MCINLFILLCLIAFANCDTLYFRPNYSLEEVTCPNIIDKCPIGNTCCLHGLINRYSCCPSMNGVCCNDHEHCCPEGYSCDLNKGGCKNITSRINFLQKYSGKKMIKALHFCPDWTSLCPNNMTCCQNQKNIYECCLYEEGVCCPDRGHCCPRGTICQANPLSCIISAAGLQHGQIFANSKKLLADVIDIVCPDQKSSCSVGETCCLLQSGQYGCCPFPNAVCCSDLIHCCPNGMTCNLEQGACVSGSSHHSWLTKIPDQIVGEDIICPDKKTSCASDQSCCLLTSGNYGCCPFPEAVCCSDHLHCCPEKTICDYEAGICKRDIFIMPWLTKLPAKSLAKKQKDIICLDKKSTCTLDQTCCLLTSGSYGCCPIPKAVCCSDHLHCCPEKTTCDYEAGICKSDGFLMPWLTKLPAKPLGYNISCLDHKSFCLAGQTCCLLISGNYGCCPMPDAVCCSGLKHCCPTGSQCDPINFKCIRGTDMFLMAEKTDAFHLIVRDKAEKKCPDFSICDDDSTCCPLTSVSYACCPLKNAVCCSDHLHCCPFGETCDVEKSRCVAEKSFPEIPWMKIEIVMCNEKYFCPANNTCCPRVDGSFNCCPVPHGSCCLDQKHCCKSFCIPFFNYCFPEEKQLTLSFSENSSFKSNTNLFDVSEAQQVTICKDHQHYCPKDYQCSDEDASCTRTPVVTGTSWYSKRPSKINPSWSNSIEDGNFHEGFSYVSISNSSLSFIHNSFKLDDPPSNKTCDNKTACPKDTTCCDLTDKAFACCQFVKATCCEDGMHCCPDRYFCDIKAKMCRHKPEHDSVSNINNLLFNERDEYKNRLDSIPLIPMDIKSNN